MTRWARRRATLRYIAEDAPSGYGDAADRLVRAMRASRLRIEYRGWGGGYGSDASGPQRHSRDPRRRERARDGAPTFVHLVPEYYPRARAVLPEGPVIAHTVWETDRIPAHWPDLLTDLDRIVVPTEWNRAVFEASGIATPVAVVPHVACVPVPGDRGAPLGLPDDVVVFYTIARWDQRKQPAAVIRAFLEAFTADDPVALVVKTSPLVQFPPPRGWGDASPLLGSTAFEIVRIAHAYPRPPHIRVEIDDWTPERIAGLHTRGDCYVALPHGEGWGLGAFDAAAYGNPVVMTGWGGQLAFLEPDAAFLVEYDLEPVQHFLPSSYGPEQNWAVPRLEHAVAVLREIAADLGRARRRAAPLAERVRNDFAGPRIVEQLLAEVPELAAAVGTPRTQHAADSIRTAVNLGPTFVEGSDSAAADSGAVRRADDELLLLGLTVGPWQSAFDNWVEMAERHGYRYELLGREVESYEAHFTKWRLLLDHLDDLPPNRLVFYLDASDGFVCDGPERTLARYRSYQRPLVLGAERGPYPTHDYDVPNRSWRWANSGCFVGEAGVVAAALRGGYELGDWADYGLVSDQHALNLYLCLPEHRHLATIDHRRTIVENLGAGAHDDELGRHRVMLERAIGTPGTSSVHFGGVPGAV